MEKCFKCKKNVKKWKFFMDGLKLTKVCVPCYYQNGGYDLKDEEIEKTFKKQKFQEPLTGVQKFFNFFK